MSICDGCIHDEVCGLEDNHEEGIVSCADMIPKDVLDKIRAEIENIAFDWQEIDGEHESFMVVDLNDTLNIIDKYMERSEE